MGKSVAESEKAEDYRRRTEYWATLADKIDLSLPESLGFFEFELHKAKLEHKDLKDNPGKRTHSYSLTYANKAVKDLDKKVNLAIKLWGTNEDIEQINKEAKEKATKKASKKMDVNSLFEKYGGFFFFGSDVDKFKAECKKLKDAGFMEEGEKVRSIGAGLYVPSKNADNFIKGI
jgi:tRNA G37 N-methylase Trm5